MDSLKWPQSENKEITLGAFNLIITVELLDFFLSGHFL